MTNQAADFTVTPAFDLRTAGGKEGEEVIEVHQELNNNYYRPVGKF